MTPTGFIDVHSHLLPGIDDGCRTVNDSIACAVELMEHGFVGTICTPHVCTDEYPENTPLSIARDVEQLGREFAAAGLDYQLWAGAEVRLAATTVAWLQRHGIPTLGYSRCVLVDYWGQQWQAFCDKTIDYLLTENYQPMLAHPERMNLADEQLEALLDRLQRSGVWFQGNLRCAIGAEGTRPLDRICRWLAEDRYHMLATDMHDHATLDARLEGITAVDELVGTESLLALLGSRAVEFLLSATVRPRREPATQWFATIPLANPGVSGLTC